MTGDLLPQWTVRLVLPDQQARTLATFGALDAACAGEYVRTRWPFLPPACVFVNDVCLNLLPRQTAPVKRRTDKPARRSKLTRAQQAALSDRWRRYWLAKHPPKTPQP